MCICSRVSLDVFRLLSRFWPAGTSVASNMAERRRSRRARSISIFLLVAAPRFLSCRGRFPLHTGSGTERGFFIFYFFYFSLGADWDLWASTAETSIRFSGSSFGGEFKNVFLFPYIFYFVSQELFVPLAFICGVFEHVERFRRQGPPILFWFLKSTFLLF